MRFFGIPSFIFGAVCFELAWAGLLVAVFPLYRKLSREQKLAAEARGELPPDYPVVPFWLRSFEVLFAATHIIAFNIVLKFRSDNRIPNTAALTINGLLIAAILYFLV